ncbi:zinc finger protein 2-like [Lacerta agilis]|uniref:zinc finger protein 2-like n=1 Tax=Lacerta agilis TaxID=80427 RepID=UPI00141A457E|nr:zinc finger protein 2-like [Lacerta agilis]
MLERRDAASADVQSENFAKAAGGPERKNIEINSDESQPPSGRSKMHSAAEQHPKEPTIFEEVSVVLMEEKEFTLDPYLLALSGNNIQQYCTMLSWLELKNPKPEIYFEMEQGVTLPLSLAHVVEEFDILPCLCQDNRTLQEPESLQQESAAVPLVRLQYNFVPELEGGVLQGKPSAGRTVSEIQQGAGLQARSEEPVSSGGNPGMPPEAPRYHPCREGPVGHFDPTLPKQEGSRQPAAMRFAAETLSQGSERSGARDVAGLNLLLRKGGHRCEGNAEEPTNHPSKGTSCLCFNASEGIGESFQIREGACAREGSFSGPREGGKPALKLNPTAPKLVPPEQPRKGRGGRPPVSFSAANLAAHQEIFTDERQELSSPLNLQRLPSPAGDKVEKPFKCPDCGKGFLHRSSIPRHRNLHCLGALPQQKSPWGENPLRGPGPGGTGLAEKKQCNACKRLSFPHPGVQKQRPAGKEPFRCPDCGKTFAEKSSMVRHRALHQSERPFRCLCCGKSYTQSVSRDEFPVSGSRCIRISGSEPRTGNWNSSRRRCRSDEATPDPFPCLPQPPSPDRGFCGEA